ncbi:unnamed protein product [Ascophyllum nodosum]
MEIQTTHAAADFRKSCDFCTSRKRRCDRVGVSPCTLCSEKGASCTFRQKGRRGPKPKVHYRNLLAPAEAASASAGVGNGDGPEKGVGPNHLEVPKIPNTRPAPDVSLESKIEMLERRSVEVDKQQEGVLAALESGGSFRGIEGKADLVDTLKSFRKEKEYLLQLQAQLQEERLILLRMGSNTSKRLLPNPAIARDSEEAKRARVPSSVPPLPLKMEQSIARSSSFAAAAAASTPHAVDVHVSPRKRRTNDDDDEERETHSSGPLCSGEPGETRASRANRTRSPSGGAWAIEV